MIEILKITDLGITDLGEQAYVDVALEKIGGISISSLTLDMTGCLIDYPSTSAIFDKILFTSINNPEEKKLLVLIDYYLPEATLLNLLFLGSKFFELEHLKDIEIEDLKSRINDKLKATRIALEISVNDRKGKVIQKLFYGGE